jgi:hypothetical protein
MLFALAFSVWALIDWARLSSLYTIGAHDSDPRSLLIWMSPIILWALIEPLFNVNSILLANSRLSSESRKA